MMAATVDPICVDIDVDERLARIRGEFLEMPGLRLTPAQARRLWGLDAGVCQCLLDRLVLAHFLDLRPNGTYGLASGDWSHVTARRFY
ncbi:MAG: hypothetical protein HY654_10640 [Acidobacteria bacterium]|nr:hypothetical protein [Acidobacteriota bacterium]